MNEMIDAKHYGTGNDAGENAHNRVGLRKVTKVSTRNITHPRISKPRALSHLRNGNKSKRMAQRKEYSVWWRTYLFVATEVEGMMRFLRTFNIATTRQSTQDIAAQLFP